MRVTYHVAARPMRTFNGVSVHASVDGTTSICEKKTPLNPKELTGKRATCDKCVKRMRALGML